MNSIFISCVFLFCFEHDESRAQKCRLKTTMTTFNSTLGNVTSDRSLYDKASSAVLLDGILQSFTIGLIAGQAFKYWADYRDDSRQKRLFTASVVLFSVLQTIIEIYKVWLIMIRKEKWSGSAIAWSDLFINGCICSMCQSFFIRRCWKMTGRRRIVLYPLTFLAALIVVLVVFMVVNMALSFSTHQRSHEEFRKLMQAMRIGFAIWTSLSLFLDVVVASILVNSLWKARAGTLAADDVVRQVISITFQSAVLPAISMITAVILSNYTTQRNLVLLFLLLTGKLYTFGFLRTLNSRDKLRKRMRSGSRDLGRTSLSPRAQFDTCAWKMATQPAEVTVQASRKADAPVDPLSIPPTVHTAEGLDTRVGIKLPVGSGIASTEFQLSSPRLDASERGIPRNRIPSRR
ncbi:hypothetical protein E1B28_004112 [Marasmius oreades]|uniref:DUF6534 domain-containing protein n=1 Tax=Marasmius oreades TaxID=181124 RepID=A0A9P7UXY1_9AGAR|nr:uncharacterized protein E1B28_004112 [Marasmius oreades]KAG7096698.1 hypothetical protein E1B28_004112 [Marasmius oreades]